MGKCRRKFVSLIRKINKFLRLLIAKQIGQKNQDHEKSKKVLIYQ